MEPFGSPPVLTATARGLWLTYGASEGWEYAFDREGALVGATTWRQSPFGDCKDGAARYRGGNFPDVGEDETLERCGFVPGRHLLQQRACICVRPKDRPTRIGLDRGPRLKYPLDCLYEFSLIGDFCQRYADRQASSPDEKVRDVGHGCVRVTHTALDAECVYDSQGQLKEARIGKRFETPGFKAACASTTNR